MEDQVAAGLFVLDGSARVRTDNGLVRLDQLSGSGPQGPPGPEGPTGPDGVDADTSQFYNKSEIDFKLLLKQSLLSTHPGNGSRVWNDASGMVRKSGATAYRPSFINTQLIPMIQRIKPSSSMGRRSRVERALMPPLLLSQTALHRLQ